MGKASRRHRKGAPVPYNALVPPEIRDFAARVINTLPPDQLAIVNQAAQARDYMTVNAIITRHLQAHPELKEGVE